MVNKEFRKQFKALFGQYPGFHLSAEGFQEAADIYFDELKYFPLDVFKIGCEKAVSLSPQFFPPLGLVKNCCEAVHTERELADRYPKAKYWPNDHGCGLDGTRIGMSRARRLLFEVSPYEAVHVLCRTIVAPRCGNCGIDVPMFQNPFILKLIDLYPEDTTGWRPNHKGNLLCGLCQGMKYPEEFMKGRSA